jgi:hypothetical protein
LNIAADASTTSAVSKPFPRPIAISDPECAALSGSAVSIIDWGVRRVKGNRHDAAALRRM